MSSLWCLCDPPSHRWAFEGTVYRSRTCRGFVGYGDADPSNVSPLVHGAEMRVAETRAVNRALRKAYGIGICSVGRSGLGYPHLWRRGPGERRWMGRHRRSQRNLCMWGICRRLPRTPNVVMVDRRGHQQA